MNDQVPDGAVDDSSSAIELCIRGEEHANVQQLELRKLASLWLIAAVGGIGLVLQSGVLSPSGSDPSLGYTVLHGLVIAAIGGVSVIGLFMLWLIDQQLHHRLLSAYFMTGLRLEYFDPNAAPLHLGMLERRTKGGTGPALLFYALPILVLFIASNLALGPFIDEGEIALLAAVAISSLSCATLLYMTWQSRGSSTQSQGGNYGVPFQSIFDKPSRRTKCWRRRFGAATYTSAQQNRRMLIRQKTIRQRKARQRQPPTDRIHAVITGGSHSGKSALINMLRGMGYNVIEEAAEKIIAEWKSNGRDRSKDPIGFQEEVAERLIHLESSGATDGRGEKLPATFYDRGAHDGFAYLRRPWVSRDRGRLRKLWESVSATPMKFSIFRCDEDSEPAALVPPVRLLEAVRRAPYTHVFVLETVTPFRTRKETGRTTATESESRAQAEALMDVYEQFGYAPIWVPFIPVDLRAGYVLRHLAYDEASASSVRAAVSNT